MYTQKQKFNIQKCLYCKFNHECKLGAVEIKPSAPTTITEDSVYCIGGSKWKPTINGKPVEQYTDLNGNEHNNPTAQSKDEALELLRNKILPACDYYIHSHTR